jgi:hypothetical protein
MVVKGGIAYLIISPNDPLGHEDRFLVPILMVMVMPSE